MFEEIYMRWSEFKNAHMTREKLDRWERFIIFALVSRPPSLCCRPGVGNLLVCQGPFGYLYIKHPHYIIINFKISLLRLVKSDLSQCVNTFCNMCTASLSASLSSSKHEECHRRWKACASVPSGTRMCPVHPVMDVHCMSLKLYIMIIINFM